MSSTVTLPVSSDYDPHTGRFELSGKKKAQTAWIEITCAV